MHIRKFPVIKKTPITDLHSLKRRIYKIDKDQPSYVSAAAQEVDLLRVRCFPSDITAAGRRM